MTLKAEHEFSPTPQLHTIARAANYPRQAQITEPQICSNASVSVPVGTVVSALPTLAYNANLPCSTPATRPKTSLRSTSRTIQVKSVEGISSIRLEVSAHSTSTQKQTRWSRGEGGQEISNPIRTSYTINKINTVPETIAQPE